MTIRRIGEWEVNDWDGQFTPALSRGPAGATTGLRSDVDLEVLPDYLVVECEVDGYGHVYAEIPWAIIREALRLRDARPREAGE